MVPCLRVPGGAGEKSHPIVITNLHMWLYSSAAHTDNIVSLFLMFWQSKIKCLGVGLLSFFFLIHCITVSLVSFKLVIYGLGTENVSCVHLLIISSQFFLVSPTDTSLVYLTFLFSISLFILLSERFSWVYAPSLLFIFDNFILNFQEVFFVLWAFLYIYLSIHINIYVASSFFMDFDLPKNH